MIKGLIENFILDLLFSALILETRNDHNVTDNDEFIKNEKNEKSDFAIIIDGTVVFLQKI
jgi:hypothetical protein